VARKYIQEFIKNATEIDVKMLNNNYKLWHKPIKNHFDDRGNLKKGETLQGYLHEKYAMRFPEKYMGKPHIKTL
jgi:hypothetical protein